MKPAICHSHSAQNGDSLWLNPGRIRVDAAYACRIKKISSYEVCLSVCNQWQDKVSSFANRRRVYGAGFKAAR